MKKCRGFFSQENVNKFVVDQVQMNNKSKCENFGKFKAKLFFIFVEVIGLETWNSEHIFINNATDSIDI